MSFPFFYSEEISTGSGTVELREETAKHVVQVLRMKTGDKIGLTNGKGYLFTTEITEAAKRSVTVRILDTVFHEPAAVKITVAISPVKNAARFEWFLEKAAEVGITRIVPLLCKRTEKLHFRADRMQNILVSAMLQSKQTWLPLLQEPVKFSEFIGQVSNRQKLIAHCEEDTKSQLAALAASPDTLILIGPEGDFTREEIGLAAAHDFKPVALGNTRLRTETAGIVAATLLANAAFH
jgi:16S rRNA (uracil1498-N3)-methyltransferase